VDGAAVIPEWNEIAQKTLADTTKAVPEGFLYMGLVQAAVYNAVVGIEGGYADLDTAYAASLAKIPDGDAETRGVAFGELAADTLIKQRADDGRSASIKFTQEPAPGVWRPTPAPTTPPNLSPFAVPWLGFVTPLLVESSDQFGDPGPPPKLTSAQYAEEFDEVKGSRLVELNAANERANRDCQVLLREWPRPVQYGTARPGNCAEVGHRQRSSHVRRGRHERPASMTPRRLRVRK
jgi:hypothetical protein